MNEEDKKILIEKVKKRVEVLLEGNFDAKTTEEGMAKMLKIMAEKNPEILPETLENITQTEILELMISSLDIEEQIRKIKSAIIEKQKNSVIPEQTINLFSVAIRSEYKKTIE